MRRTIDLHPNERIALLVRRSVWAEKHAMAVWALFLLAPFFLLFPIILLGMPGIIAGAIVFAIGLLLLARWWKKWNNTMLLVTDSRVIDSEQLGWFSREVTDIELKDVRDVRVDRAGTLARMLDIGALTIVTKQSVGFDIRFEGVRHPDDIAKTINEVQFLLKQEKVETTFHVKTIA